jgi:endonuclease/exonuclease/phosphatase family metal-dependent hydrolase
VIGLAFDLVSFTPGVRFIVSHPAYEKIFRSVCHKQKPLEGWPQTMSLWERWRLLGRALQNNCNVQPPAYPLGLRVLRECEPPGASIARQDKTTLRIFNQNIWNSHFLGGPNRAERLQLLVDHLDTEDYDVCVFQELFTFGFGPVRMDAECRWLEENLRERGYIFSTCATVASQAPMVGQDAGVQAFSRLPLDQITVTRFSNCRALSQKGILKARIELPTPPGSRSEKVYLFATHLEHSDQAKQTVQVQELADCVQAVSGQPAIALGDMNICEGNYRGRMYGLLQQTMASVSIGHNLSAGLRWTCDHSMARDPTNHPLHLLSDHPATKNQAEAESPERDFPKFGATIDHCWVATEWAALGASATAMQLVGQIQRPAPTQCEHTSEGATGPDQAQLALHNDGVFAASDHLAMVYELSLPVPPTLVALDKNNP